MAGSILRLRSAVAAAAVGRQHFASSYSSPCLMLPPDKMYSLCEKKVVNMDVSSELEKELESDWVIGSSHRWVSLLKYSEKDPDLRSLSLWNPMSGSRVKLPPIPAELYLNPRWGTSKLVVDDAECSRAVMMPPLSSNWLAVCCPDECSEWTLFGPDQDSYQHFDKNYYDVVARSRHRVYSLDGCEGSYSLNLVRWDISDPQEPRIESKKRLPELIYKDDIKFTDQHLVYAENSGQLFIVSRHFEADKDMWNYEICFHKTVAFDVHLLVENENEDEIAVRYMEQSLDGLVMFVGHDNSFAVAAADYPHLNADSIYFTTNIFNWCDSNIYGCNDVGIYDYKNRTLSSVGKTFNTIVIEQAVTPRTE